MTVPLWAEEKMMATLKAAPEIRNGKVIFTAEFSYSNGGLGGVKTKVAHEEDHRPPK